MKYLRGKEAASKSSSRGGVNTFQNKNGLGGPIEMKVCAFERGDQGASLEKRMKSFGDVVADFW